MTLLRFHPTKFSRCLNLPNLMFIRGKHDLVSPQLLRQHFFIANGSWRQISHSIENITDSSRRKQTTAAFSVSQRHEISSTVESKPTAPSVAPDEIIPPDASSQLTSHASTLPRQSFRRSFAAYLSLTKPRLTFLMVLTTTAAYSLFPTPTVLDASLTTEASLSTLTLLYLTTGTALTAASANAFNMYLEPDHDALMSRTRNRPLVRGLISRRAACLFAITTGIIGSASLLYGVNPTTAALGAGNIALYAAIYTPMKRVSPLNTWIGAVVGAIPPLMGWTAAAGQFAVSADWKELLLSPEAAGGWALAALLFAWQIPHFAGLSFSIRNEYAAAGYKMLATSNPRLDAILSLGCALLLPLCTAELLAAQVIEPWTSVAVIPANTWMVWESWRFLRQSGGKGTARKLFWASVWYLPIVLVMCMIGKKGMMESLWKSMFGEIEEEQSESERNREEKLTKLISESKPATKVS